MNGSRSFVGVHKKLKSPLKQRSQINETGHSSIYTQKIELKPRDKAKDRQRILVVPFAAQDEMPSAARSNNS
jgi:hypothetical protein